MPLNPRLVLAGVLGLVALILLLDGVFILDQRQQALVVRLGAPIRELTTPGLKLKVPFIDQVLTFERRILDLDSDANLNASQSVVLADQNRIIVDTFTRYRVTNPRRFYQTVQTVENLESRLSAIVNDRMRQQLARVVLDELLAGSPGGSAGSRRVAIMNDIRAQVKSAVEGDQGLGIEIIDIRIRRADLPEDTRDAVFQRMITERREEAAQLRAVGAQKARVIEAEAQRQVAVLRSEGEQRSAELVGQGDKDANRILNTAYAGDPEFFRFFRSLQAYRGALASPETTLVLTPEGEFFRYFNSAPGTGTPDPAATPRP